MEANCDLTTLALDGELLASGRRDATLQRICAEVAAAKGYPLVAIALAKKDGSAPFVAHAGSASTPRPGAVDSMGVARASGPDVSGLKDATLRTRQTQLLALSQVAGREELDALEASGVNHLIAIPLVMPNAALGVLCIGAGKGGDAEPEQLQALESFAERLSLALQFAEQRSLLEVQGAAMALSSSAHFITDAYGRIEWVNAAFERLSGYSKEEALGRTPAILRSELQSKDVFQRMWTTVRSGQSWRGEIINRRKTGETYVVCQSVTPLMNEQHQVAHLVATHDDVSAQEEARTQIEYMAHHDPLTDLPNRASFVERLQFAIARGETEGGCVGVLCLDLDRFKLVNDTLGHALGDRLLRDMAERLKASVRGHDVVARFDGDEFTVVLPGCDSGVATRIAERILENICRPAPVGSYDVSITASIGIAFSSPVARDADALIKQAHLAMHGAKEMGRNGYAFYKGIPDARPVPDLTIQSGLRQALLEGGLRLQYQPQMRASGRQLVGVEALLRWTSPTLGPVSPAHFIPVAEQTGLIVDIDQWVLRAACAQAKTWRAAGIDVPRLAVNISGVTFRRGKLVTWIEEALASADLAPGCLEIELTEGVLMRDAEQVIENLANLRRLGVRVALDDFGTGYSSLSYLKRFKLDVLKIDRSFVNGLPDDADSVAIARLIVAMAKALRMEVVAEGVETSDQAAFLEGLGCDILQGFLFSGAVAPAELTRWARRQEGPGTPAEPALSVAV